MKGNTSTFQLTSSSLLQNTQNTGQDEIQYLPLDILHRFKDHPFKMYRDDRMDELVESIKQNGLFSPILVRPRAEGGGYEIVAGHNRAEAMNLAGFEEIPAIVKEMDDDTAICAMVDSNLQQREKLYPSERAWAYRMKLEAMKRQGERSDLTSPQVAAKFRSDDEIAKQSNISGDTVQRYIRLTYLIEPLQTLVDLGEVSFIPAVEVSYLKESEQIYLASVIAVDEVKLSLAQAKTMKELSRKDELDDDKIEEIMLEEKPSQVKVTLKSNVLYRHFPKGTTPREMQEEIIKLLEGKSNEVGVYRKYFPKNTQPKEMRETIVKLLEDWSKKKEMSNPDIDKTR